MLPQRASKEPLFRLPHLLTLQMFHHEGGGGDGAGLAVFGGNQLIRGHTLLLVELHLLVDGQHAGIEVYAVPCQAQHLTLPQTGEQRHDKDVFVAVALDRIQKGRNLRFIQWLDLLLLTLRKLTEIAIRRIQRYIAVYHRLPQCSM